MNGVITNKKSKYYQLEMNEHNYEMMLRCMDAYVKTRNRARERQRHDTTKKQVRAIEDIKFEFKMLKEFERLEQTRISDIPEIFDD
jgi:hypothetical protein